MAGDAFQDVPSPIDFHDLDAARAWTQETVARKPYRAEFFDAFARALDACSSVVSVLELGSGPGHLAEQILLRTSVSTYTLLDFSAAMHDLARERVAVFADRVRFVQADFRDVGWHLHLESPDVVVTMQAVHELRHKERTVQLYRQIFDLLEGSGVFLVCDTFADDPVTTRNADLFMTRMEQRTALEASGFCGIEVLLETGGMTLHRAIKSG